MIAVLRLGHRPERDKRITTHVALVARAMGASVMYLEGEDRKIVENIEEVTKNWGGDFRVICVDEWKKVMREWKGVSVHLTMYGEDFEDVASKVRNQDVLIIVGASKVPPEVYELADYNASVGNQPHSEVSALALFLDRLTEGKWKNLKFKNAKIEIIPSKRGKKVVRHENPGSRL
ncbi:MAG: tRNA (cytidine56-2-O)-methyltransferase [Archaeoglobi archaeon]|nr:tRNA (cytidine56-2-O)-methyltransferase [Archaeoglobi archaeon]MDK2781372.1 tRNA (cytidine56-2-O)-methyltransferase [Archaeoglobi archaeon]